MKIKITTAAVPAVTVVLGDDLAKAYISGYLPKSSTVVEEAALWRATSITEFDRKNLKTTLVFRVDRSHGSEALGMKFVSDHFIAVPRRGHVEVSQQGSGAFMNWLANAVVARMDVLSLNSSSLIEYEIWGGQWLTTNPA